MAVSASKTNVDSVGQKLLKACEESYQLLLLDSGSVRTLRTPKFQLYSELWSHCSEFPLALGPDYPYVSYTVLYKVSCPDRWHLPDSNWRERRFVYRYSQAVALNKPLWLDADNDFLFF